MDGIDWGDGDRRFRWKPLLLILAGLGCIGLLYLGYKVVATNFYQRALPAALITEGLATTGSDVGVLSLLLPIRPEACGGAIFHLADQSVTGIAQAGLAFFQNAVEGRGYPQGHRLHYFYRYKPWRETPVPHAWTSDGMWPGLACVRASAALAEAILKAAREPSSYYTTKPSAELLVIPRLKLVVFTYTQ
jgi:hypothetical protein